MAWTTHLKKFVPRSLVGSNAVSLVAEPSIYGLAQVTGAIQWTVVPDADTSLGLPAVMDGVFYVGSAVHEVFAIEAATGRIIWRRKINQTRRYPDTVRAISGTDRFSYVTSEKCSTRKRFPATNRLVKPPEAPQNQGRPLSQQITKKHGKSLFLPTFAIGIVILVVVVLLH